MACQLPDLHRQQGWLLQESPSQKDRLAPLGKCGAAFGKVGAGAGLVLALAQAVFVVVAAGDQVLERLEAADRSEQLTAVDIMMGTFAQASSQPWRGEVSLEPVLLALRDRLNGEQSIDDICDSIARDWSIDADDVLVHALAGMKALVDLGLRRAADWRQLSEHRTRSGGAGPLRTVGRRPAGRDRLGAGRRDRRPAATEQQRRSQQQETDH